MRQLTSTILTLISTCAALVACACGSSSSETAPVAAAGASAGTAGASGTAGATGKAGAATAGVAGTAGASGAGAAGTAGAIAAGTAGASGAGSAGAAGAAGTPGASGAAGAGQAGAAGGGAAGSAQAGAAGSPSVKCGTLSAGLNTLTVGGVPRMLQVQLPAQASSKVALLFLWHGWNQLPSDFSGATVYDVPSGKWVSFDPNAFAMPLVIVTPYSQKLLPPVGLDWDIADGSLDFAYFEAMLGCLQQQFDVDGRRVYSMGFSAGAVFTNLLSARYPHTFAATISESGMWLNDKPEQADIQFGFIVNWQWPALSKADGGSVLLTHGGPGDYATVANLEAAAAKAVPFLTGHGRTVTECWHTFGHTLDPDLTQGMYYDYLWAHELGSPPLAAPVPGFPTEAAPVGATRCRLHPAL